jgi:hypothetical protein
LTKRFLVVSALAVGVFVLGSCTDNAAGPATTPQTRSPVGMSTDLSVTGTDRMRFEPDASTAPAEIPSIHARSPGGLGMLDVSDQMGCMRRTA